MEKIAMGTVIDGSIRIRKGPSNKPLPWLVIPPRFFDGIDPAVALRGRLAALEAIGYRILPWEDRKPRGNKPRDPAEPERRQNHDFPRIHARMKTPAEAGMPALAEMEITPESGAGPRIAEHFGDAISLAVVRPGDAVTIEPGGSLADLFFALTEASAGHLLLADAAGNLVQPIPWLKASGLLEDPALLEAARRFGLLGAMSLLGEQASEAWFA